MLQTIERDDIIARCETSLTVAERSAPSPFFGGSSFGALSPPMP
jgi:hypothetical protein